MTDQNEEQLREGFFNEFAAWDYSNKRRTKNILAHIDDVTNWWLKALHQAELNWITAQIERGKKMHRADWYKEGNRNNAIDDLNAPLIERKKELEGIIGKE